MNPVDAVRLAYEDAQLTFDLPSRVAEAVRAAETRPSRAPRRAIAIGKAAVAMLEGALRVSAYEEVLGVVPELAVAVAHATSGVTFLEGAHPVPDARSLVAGEALLEFVGRTTEGTLDVFVSGGASALACAPSAGLDLAAKAELTRVLLASGADVSQINVVRRHVSRIKGGGLLRHLGGPALVRSFIVSDVLGGPVWDVGSGPSVADPTRVADARAALERFAPRYAHVPLTESVDPDSLEASRSVAAVVADARSFSAHVAACLRRTGFAVHVLPERRGVDANALADELAARAALLDPEVAFVLSVEPCVVVPSGAGRGGRATHLAALTLPRLPSDVVLLSAATDGVDGSSGTAGVVARRDDVPREALARAAEAFDTGPFFASAGVAFPGAPSGLNFADLVVLARAATT